MSEGQHIHRNQNHMQILHRILWRGAAGFLTALLLPILDAHFQHTLFLSKYFSNSYWRFAVKYCGLIKNVM